MNAAAKIIQQSNVFQGHWDKISLSRELRMRLVLLFLALTSAFSVVYVINLHRITCSQMQSVLQTTHHLQLQWGQLLLEQASLATPGRIESVAKEKLHMVFPSHEQTFSLRAE